MSSSDWWPSQSTSQAYSTPSRPTQATYAAGGGGGGGGGFNPLAQSSHTPLSAPSFNNAFTSSSGGALTSSSSNHFAQSRSRFAGDELDAEDLQRADNVKFYPTFASSPAGKIAASTSAAQHLSSSGGKTNSPPARRSPQARFSFGGNVSSPNDAASPRAGRTARTYPSPNSPEDEGPPTLSLRDATSAPSASTSMSLAQHSPAAVHQPDLSVHHLASSAAPSTKLHVFGPPLDQLPQLHPWLSEFGEIKSYAPGAAGVNWYIVEYVSPVSASYALRRHGEIVGGRYMVGFKVASGGYDETAEVVPNNPGSRIEVVTQKNVLKVKQPVQGQAKPDNDGMAWDETEPPSGIINKAAEWLFGR